MIDRSTSTEQSTGSSVTDGTRWSVLVLIVLLAIIFWLIMTNRVPEPSSHPAVGRPAPLLDLVQLIPGRPQAMEPADEDLAVELTDEDQAVGPGDQAGEQPQPRDPLSLTGLPAAGAVTLLHLWGTWCPPCKLEYPELVELARELEAEPQFRFVSVSCGAGGFEDYDSLQAETARYYQSIGADTLETFADLGGETRRSVTEQLNDSLVYPTTILISADQRIAAVWLGYAPEGVSEMRQAIEEELEKLP